METRQFIAQITPKNNKTIVYGDITIPIDFNLLQRNCNYFSNNNSSRKDTILLLEEEGPNKISEKSIRDFISCCQNQIIDINYSNIFDLHYLSKKYQFEKLTEFTKSYISDYKNQLALDSIIFDLQMNNNKNFSLIDTSEEEKIISNNLPEFINDERLVNLPIPILHSILKNYHSIQESSNQQQELQPDIFVNFLFKLLEKHGRKASLFFTFLKIDQNRLNDLFKLKTHFSDVFDPHFLNSSLMDTTIELIQETENLRNQFDQYKGQSWKTDFTNDQNRFKNLIPTKQKWNIKSHTESSLSDSEQVIVVTASSSEGPGHEVCNLFNGQGEINGQIICWRTHQNDRNQSIQIKFKIPVVANALLMKARNPFMLESPTLIEIFGVDGQTKQEKSLDKFVQLNWKIDETRIVSFVNDVPYSTYIIRFYSSNTGCVGLSELNIGTIQ